MIILSGVGTLTYEDSLSRSCTCWRPPRTGEISSWKSLLVTLSSSGEIGGVALRQAVMGGYTASLSVLEPWKAEKETTELDVSLWWASRSNRETHRVRVLFRASCCNIICHQPGRYHFKHETPAGTL